MLNLGATSGVALLTISTSHILILVLIIVIIFGASRLPSVARNLGKSAKIFRDEVKSMNDDSSKAESVQDESAKELEAPRSANDSTQTNAVRDTEK